MREDVIAGRHGTSESIRALAENEALRAVVAPFAFVMVDEASQVTRFNATLAELTGLNWDEIPGRPLTDLLPPAWQVTTPMVVAAIETGASTVDVEVVEIVEIDEIDDVQGMPDVRDSSASKRYWMTSCHPIVVDKKNVGALLVAVDVSSQRRAEDETRFHGALIAASGQAIAVVDLNRVITYWSDAAASMYGWSADEVIGLDSTQLFPEESDQRRGAIAELLRQRTRWSGEHHVTRRDGSPMIGYLTYNPMYDGDGSLVAVIIVAVDITDRKRSEKLTQLLSAIVAGSGDAIIGLTIEGRVTSWNQAAEVLFGYTATEAVGQPIALIGGDRTAEQAEIRRGLIAGGATQRWETIRRRKDGTDFDVLLTNSTIKDDSGALIGFSVIARDITARLEAQRGLEASQKRLAESQRNAHLGSFDFRISTRGLSCSDEFFRILGLDPAFVLSSDQFMSYVHPDDGAAFRHAWNEAVVDGVSFDIQFRILRDQEVRFVRVRAVPEVSGETVLTVAGTMMDDTERVEAELVKRVAETRFEIGFEQSRIGAVIAGIDGIPIRVNNAACEILGRPAEELVGQRWGDLSHPDEVPLPVVAQRWFAEGHDTYQDDRRYVRPDGSVVWTSMNLTVARDEQGLAEYVLVQIQDITSRKKLENELAHLALHDALTGLPNRALLDDRITRGLEWSRRRGTHLGVIFLDVDRFKVINDSMGHPAGDELLSEVARRISGAIRASDTVARFGGDEFVVVCDVANPAEVDGVAQKILGAVAQPLLVGDHDLEVTASIGFVVADATSNPESLLRDSDAAMYRAKERGRGRVEQFDQAMRSDAQRQLTTGSAIHAALDNDEFVLHYQPIVDLTSGRLLGVEALVRWNRPGAGLVGPDAFIPFAEETGLIVPLGAWVLERTCRDLVGWQSMQPDLTVAVNVSVAQLLAPGAADMVADVFTRTGARPADVCLELTESIFMEDVAYFGQILGSLKEIGTQLAIDDFGIGYSSLSYLQQFPVNVVKVDRAFVNRLGLSQQGTALVAAIVAMADALGLQVIAEGIETQDQLGALQELGVTRAQGYYFARPAPAATIDELIRTQQVWKVT